jgi:hypothetical protein
VERLCVLPDGVGRQADALSLELSPDDVLGVLDGHLSTVRLDSLRCGAQRGSMLVEVQ